MYKQFIIILIFSFTFQTNLFAHPLAGDTLKTTGGWTFLAKIEQELTCNHSNDGVIRISGVPGFSRAQYSLDGEYWQNSPVFKSLPAGIYQPRVLFEDGNLTKLAKIEIKSPTPLQLETAVMEDTLNWGYLLQVSAEGGTGEIWFAVDGKQASPESLFEISKEGKHIILAEDEAGCFVKEEVWIGAD
ncbi:MAG: hypothetical protein H6581_12640 [Bacteroidia bacterium]|nr:hypothetical protein [Bacteroidia bacterium]